MTASLNELQEGPSLSQAALEAPVYMTNYALKVNSHEPSEMPVTGPQTSESRWGGGQSIFG